MKQHCLGFLINPIAGMGGRVGLKGTDDVIDRAVALGASPSAQHKAAEALGKFHELLDHTPGVGQINWLTCAGNMGADALQAAGHNKVSVVYEAAAQQTTKLDTKVATRCFCEQGVELVLFCGGDGTARDICSITGQEIPILGIPAGVKMFSGIFGISPARTAEILLGFLRQELTLAQADVLDLDEEQYRQGEWRVKLYAIALVPVEPSYTQTAKALFTASDEQQVKAEIADYLKQQIEVEQGTLFLLGPGSTVAVLGERLGIRKTLLGVDAVAAGKQVGKDLNEQQLLKLLQDYQQHKLIISPIGAQGFVLGRGNLQLSPAVVKIIGTDNIIVIATPAKLARTPLLRVDTGDSRLDQALAGRGYLTVVTGFAVRRLVKIVI